MPSARPIAPSPSPRLGRTDTAMPWPIGSRSGAEHRDEIRGHRRRRAARAAASPRRSATSTFSIHQPLLRDPPRDLGEQPHRVGVAVLLVGRGKQRAEVGKAGRPEQRVGDRVRDRVAVGVTGEPRRVGDRHAAEHERRRVAERMHVEAQTDAVRSSRVRPFDQGLRELEVVDDA